MRLKELRLQHNLLQKDIAAMLNCSTPVYCRYEKGDREPPFETIKRLADYYGVTVDYLMGRDEIPAPQHNEPLQQTAPEPEQPKRTFMIYGRTYNGRTMQEMYEELPPAQQAAIERLVTVLFAESRKEGE